MSSPPNQNIPYKEALCAAIGGWLLFFCQPITGKLLTPALGGSPSGWLIVMLWFQGSLLLGNLLALSLRRFNTKTQTGALMLATFGVITAGIYFPHPTIPETTLENPLQILGFLWGTLGPQAIILGMVTATMARLALAKNTSAKYVLFASNLGALAGLTSSILSEIWLHLQISQTLSFYGWVLLGAILLYLIGTSHRLKDTREKGFSFSTKQTFSWTKTASLAALSCSILITSTEKICSDIGSSPIGWIPPLAIFLGTYLAAFSPKNPKAEFLQSPALWSTVALLGLALIKTSNLPTTLILLLATILPLWFIHSKIAELQPSNPETQASFTTAISLGGIAGSCLWAIAAPTVLNFNYDFIIVTLLTLAFLTKTRNALEKPRTWLILTLAYIPSLVILQRPEIPEEFRFMVLISTITATTILAPNLAAIGATILFVSDIINPRQTTLQKNRNLFGNIRILENTHPEGKTRILVHGNTTHGTQTLTPNGWDKTPTSYYNQKGPLGDIIPKTPSRILVVGLGVGTISGYQPVTYIEIDPHVIDAAKTHFGFLTPQCKIIQGDGRTEIKSLQEEFDLIIIDAFSSDSIPAHLITLEALQIYNEKLAPNGRITIHISNRFYNLEHVIAKSAEQAGLYTFERTFQRKQKNQHSSQWVSLQQENLPPTPEWTSPTPTKKPLRDYQGSLLENLKIPER